MKRLEFINPMFNHGENFTVRLGRKWLDAAIGEMVEIACPIGKSINSLGEITKLYHCRLAEMPEEVYIKEHDRMCDNFGGLVEAMRLAYPSEFPIDKSGEDIENTVVTCVGFKLYHLY